MVNAVSSQAAPADLVEVGRVLSAYGVRGWIKIQSHSATAEALLAAPQWWLARPASPVAQGVVTSAASESAALAANAVAHRVVTVRSQGSNLVAQLGAIDDRDVAEGMRGMSICVSRSTFPKADDDEYYWIDLIGCRLYGDREGESVLIGEVAEVVDNGAHGVLKVITGALASDGATFEPVLDAKGRPAETLVPFVGAHIQKVDLGARRIDSDWPVDF